MNDALLIVLLLFSPVILWFWGMICGAIICKLMWWGDNAWFHIREWWKNRANLDDHENG